MDDPFRLRRFLDAQEPVYEEVLRELRAGRKTGHWIWFIFPQLRGLGQSYNSTFYGIASAAEAEAYARHPILGPRLRECTSLLNSPDGQTIGQILGAIDAMKFRSSMTLFAAAVPDPADFEQALQRYFGGELDPLTLSILKSP